MKRLALILLLSGCVGKAATVYVAQTATGNGSGADASDRMAVATVNSSWGLNPGDTLSLGGVFTTGLVIGGSGAAGNPVTIMGEPGAIISRPCGLLIWQGQNSYLVITNLILQNTANGTGMSYHTNVSGIYSTGCHDVRYDTLTVSGLYFHKSPSDSDLDFSASGGIYIQGVGNNISVVNSRFGDICWILNFASGNGTNIAILGDSFTNYDHALAGFGNSLCGILVSNCDFGSASNWDTTANSYHHDAIHWFYGAGGVVSNAVICANRFHGNFGINNTAFIFMEGDYTHANPASMFNLKFFNNVFLQDSNNVLNNGFISGGGTHWTIANNTLVGSGLDNSYGLFTGGTNFTFVNNLISGVETFVDYTPLPGGVFSNNLYAAQAGGGNPPFFLDSSVVTNFTAWQTVVGEANSIFTGIAAVHGDGTLAGALGINSGANLSSLFTTDFNGQPRPPAGAWDIGAFQPANNNSLLPPVLKIIP